MWKCKFYTINIKISVLNVKSRGTFSLIIIIYYLTKHTWYSNKYTCTQYNEFETNSQQIEQIWKFVFQYYDLPIKAFRLFWVNLLQLNICCISLFFSTECIFRVCIPLFVHVCSLSSPSFNTAHMNDLEIHTLNI